MMPGCRARLLGLSLLLLPACNGSDSSGPSGQPFITDLLIRYSPAAPRPGQLAVIGLRVTFVDTDGDLVGGTCRFHGTGGTEDTALITPTTLPANAHTGLALCLAFTRQFIGVNVGLTLSVVDRAGHESNRIQTVVTIEAPRRG